MKKQFLSYDEVTRGIGYITTQMIANEFNPDIIVGVARGGLVPATILSHQLDIPMIAITHQLRDGSVEMSPELITAIKMKESILIVDDVCDTAETLKSIEVHYGIKDYPDVRYAVVVDKKMTHDFEGVDYFGYQATDDEDASKWIVFPWESQE